MFSLKRNIFAAASIGVALALFAGCKTSESQSPQLPPAPAAPVVKANPPVPPTPPPLQPGVKLPPDSGDNLAPNILDWNKLSEEYHAKPGEMLAPFTFALTNVSGGPIVIYDASTTCDCTVASLPSKPWTLPNGAAGEIHATIDLSNKVGIVTNQIVVFTSRGNRRLFVKAFTAGSQ